MKDLKVGPRVGVMVLGLAVVISGASPSFADETKSQTLPPERSVQGLALPAQKSKFFNVPRLQGIRTPIHPKGGTMNFSCGVTSCTCHGDADCNNMFSSKVCGQSAVCDETHGVECSCLRY